MRFVVMSLNTKVTFDIKRRLLGRLAVFSPETAQ